MIELILIGIFFLFILVVGHELGHFLAAKFFGLRVDEFGIGFPPRLFSKYMGGTEYSINALPFGGFVRIYGEHSVRDRTAEEPSRSFAHQPAWKRLVIIAAGAFMNFLIGWAAFTAVYAVGMRNSILIEKVLPGSPASEAGIEAGTYISGFDSAESFIAYIDANRGKEIEINGKTVVPRINPPEQEGALGVVVTETGIPREGIIKSVWKGFVSAVAMTAAIAKAFGVLIWGLIGGDFSAASGIAGPVGVFSILSEASKLGAAYLIQFLGLISLNLVVINLIPFPALDGGRFLFILAEKVAGRELSYRLQIATNAIGLALLLILMVVITIRDIMRIL